jgi:hypothetical protein
MHSGNDLQKFSSVGQPLSSLSDCIVKRFAHSRLLIFLAISFGWPIGVLESATLAGQQVQGGKTIGGA